MPPPNIEQLKCEHCGYVVLTPLTEGAADDPTCRVCLDGQVDPWAMIRDIRTLVESLKDLLHQQSSAAGTQPPDPFRSDWRLIQHSIRRIWAELHP